MEKTECHDLIRLSKRTTPTPNMAKVKCLSIDIYGTSAGAKTQRLAQ